MSLGTALLIGADCEARSQLNKSLYERKYFSFTREIDCSKDAVAIINHFQHDFLFTEVDLGDKDAFSLLERHPEVILKIPLKYIATYLGIHTDSLSRIRKKVVL